MADDLVARLRNEREALHAGLSTIVHCQSHLTRKEMREAAGLVLEKAGLKPKWFGGDQSPFVRIALDAEARVRELEAQLADQRAMSKYNREQAEKAERALAEAYDRAAKTCEQVQKDFLSPEYAIPQPAGSIGERFACGICAEEIRKLAQEVKHEAE